MHEYEAAASFGQAEAGTWNGVSVIVEGSVTSMEVKVWSGASGSCGVGQCGGLGPLSSALLLEHL